MEQSQNIKTISTIVVIVLVLGVGYLFLGKSNAPGKINSRVSSDNNGQKPMDVVVEKASVVNGTLSVPAGFPQDIPLERGGVLDGATTQYPGKNAKQFSISYKSSKTVTEKYTEYKNYMTKAGYSVTEGGANYPVRSLFGTSNDINLSVAISKSDGKTLIQLSVLLKSI